MQFCPAKAQDMTTLSFRTQLPPLPNAVSIHHNTRLILIGSCFTEHIGQKLDAYKFKTLHNPFGIVYNPVSMAGSLERIALGNSLFSPEDLFENNGLWHSWEHHGRFSKPDQLETLEGINAAYQTAVQKFPQTDCLLLTFGTADVFTLRETGKVVANNHKMPASLFETRRLSVSEISEAGLRIFEKMPHTKIVLTVSPVRHLRSGLIDNQRSKATLILACEEICKHLDRAFYFPAYELLQDDLRDYRFYAADMIHPSDLAIEYIWAYFSATFFSNPTRQLNEQIEKIHAAAQHRPFHPGTEQHQAFVRAQLAAIEKLKLDKPFLDFGREIDLLMGKAQG